MSEADILGSYRAKVGESSWWDAARQAHWSVDVFAPAIVRTELTGSQEVFPMPEMAGAVVSSTGSDLLVALESGLFRFDPDRQRKPVRFAAPDDLPPTHRLNDATIDPAGNLIIGTMEKKADGRGPGGKLYRFDGRRWSVLAAGFVTINGLACSPAGRTLYWSDSAPEVNRIWSASYDPHTGALGAASVFCDMNRLRGRPDGAAMDAEGGYWIAAVGGGCLHRFLPSGDLDRTIDLPVDHPTKPAFGGTDLRRLMVTSLSIRDSRAETAANAGAIVSLKIDVAGCPIPSIDANRFFAPA